MKRKSEQLHIASASHDEFAIEEILKEFGAAEEKKSTVTSDTIRFAPVKVEESVAVSDEPIKVVHSFKEVQVKPMHAAQSPVIKICEPPPEPEEVPQETPKQLRRTLAVLQLRKSVLFFVMLVGLLLLLCRSKWPQMIAPVYAEPWTGLILLGVASLLSYEVIWRALRELWRLRISLYTLGTVAVVLCLTYSLAYRDESYAPLVVIQLYFLQSALVHEKRAVYYTMKTVESFSAPMGVCDAPQLLENADSLRRDKGDTEDFKKKLTRSSLADDLLRVYASVLLVLLPCLAFLLARYRDLPFFRVWMMLLFGAVPCAGMLSYHRPFAAIAKRLASYGGALCGWHGAQIFGGKHTIILRDGDLFPHRNITSNGMKLYGTYEAGRLLSYALAALELAQSPLTGLFETLLQQHYGRHSRVTEHRFYDHGGIGVEIGKDIVLVGSLDFMRSMGVEMPAGTRVKQALYVSVNGELAGIFALKYKPSNSTKTGLHDILTNRNFSIVLATRDFLITPELIAAKYDLPTEMMIFPDYNERLRLSETNPEQAMSQGALIAEDTFGAFAVTVASGRTLRSTSLLTVSLSLFAGIMGLLVCILLISWGALAVASPMHIAAFQLLWALVNVFVSFILLKF